MRLRKRHAWGAVLIFLFVLPVVRPEGIDFIERPTASTVHWFAEVPPAQPAAAQVRGGPRNGRFRQFPRTRARDDAPLEPPAGRALALAAGRRVGQRRYRPGGWTACRARCCVGCFAPMTRSRPGVRSSSTGEKPTDCVPACRWSSVGCTWVAWRWSMATRRWCVWQPIASRRWPCSSRPARGWAFVATRVGAARRTAATSSRSSSSGRASRRERFAPGRPCSPPTSTSSCRRTFWWGAFTPWTTRTWTRCRTLTMVPEFDLDVTTEVVVLRTDELFK